MSFPFGSEFTVGIGSRRIEVPQSYRADSVSALEVRERVLDRQFRLPVRIDGRRRVRLYERNLGRLTVNGTGRGKYKVPAPLRPHRLESGERPSDVVLIVGRGIANRVRYDQQRREMHHRGGAALPDCAPHGIDVANITLNQRCAERCFSMSCRQIIENHYPAAREAQGLGAVTADVARTSGDQNRTGLRGGLRRGQWSSR